MTELKPESPQSALPAHLPALDGLRGIAILLVMVHMFTLLEPHPGLVAYVYYKFNYVGWTGVQLFFVLSGFLITGILLDSRASENYYRSFFARRALRIFPLYFAVLTVAFVLVPMFGTVPPAIARDQPNQLWLWTYMENWAGILGFGSRAFPHFWSLAVEEQFYLLWPFLIYRLSPEKCLRFCLALAVASLAIRCWLVWGGASHEVIYPNSFCRMDALGLGAAAAAAFRIPVWREWLIARRNILLRAAFILTLVGIVVTRGFWHMTTVGQTVGYSLLSVIFVMLLSTAVAHDQADARREPNAGARSSRWARLLRWPPLRTLGKYSYGMYVFHKPLHDFAGVPLVQALGLPVAQSVAVDLAYVLVMVLVTLAMAALSYHLFEIHFLGMKRFFVPRARPQPDPRLNP